MAAPVVQAQVQTCVFRHGVNVVDDQLFKASSPDEGAKFGPQMVRQCIADAASRAERPRRETVQGSLRGREKTSEGGGQYRGLGAE